jgi:hypothetical protein
LYPGSPSCSEEAFLLFLLFFEVLGAMLAVKVLISYELDISPEADIMTKFFFHNKPLRTLKRGYSAGN